MRSTGRGAYPGDPERRTPSRAPSTGGIPASEQTDENRDISDETSNDNVNKSTFNGTRHGIKTLKRQRSGCRRIGNGAIHSRINPTGINVGPSKADPVQIPTVTAPSLTQAELVKSCRNWVLDPAEDKFHDKESVTRKGTSSQAGNGRPDRVYRIQGDPEPGLARQRNRPQAGAHGSEHLPVHLTVYSRCATSGSPPRGEARAGNGNLNHIPDTGL